MDNPTRDFNGMSEIRLRNHPQLEALLPEMVRVSVAHVRGREKRMMDHQPRTCRLVEGGHILALAKRVHNVRVEFLTLAPC